MEFLQNLLADGLNGFSLKHIPFFLFQLLSAGFIAHMLQIILNRKSGEIVLSNSALLAIMVCLVSSIVKFSLPFSILGAAVILLFLNQKKESQLANLATLVVVGIGVGCGIGSVIQTAIGLIIIGAVILFTPLKK